MTLGTLRTLRKLLPALRKKPQPDFWQFALAAGEVMGTRISRAMIGTLTAAEARRMVEEKRQAAFNAHFVCAEAMLKGQPAAAPRAYFDVYQRAVESNRKRLRGHRPFWLQFWRQRRR